MVAHEWARVSLGAEIADKASILPIPSSLSMLRTALRVAVVGSQKFPELERVDRLVERLHPSAFVISGGADGVDKRAVSTAHRFGRRAIEIKPYEPQPREMWIACAFERDKWFGLVSDVVVAFWDGESHGTKATIWAALHAKGFCVVALPGRAPEIWVPKLNFAARPG